MEQQIINNHTILHTGNHNEMFNPHSQYVLKNKYDTEINNLNKNKFNYIMPIGKDYLNKYVEIVSIFSKCSTESYNKTLTYDFKMIMDGNLTATPTLGEIYIKINNTKEQSFCKTILMNGDFIKDNFKQILYTDNGNLYYKLYYKINRNWSPIQSKQEYCFDTAKIFTINHTGIILEELPVIEGYEFKDIKETIVLNN